jgi:S-DNA-T family DNA segregation ATPase FtsK/SpoIIIE
LQDPRKETIPFRDLFPTRIALALVEAEQTDLVLGRGARQRGADCSRIPLTQPGTAWVWCDGETEPTRVRASWVSDDDIAALAATYAPARRGSGTAGGGQVVDLPPVEDDEPGAA